MLVLRSESEDSMSEKRPDGYYWVRIGDESKIAYWGYKTGMFHVGGFAFGESGVEIGPPCSRDDSEQLRMAREVLVRLLGIADRYEKVNGDYLASMIDESGVRL